MAKGFSLRGLFFEEAKDFSSSPKAPEPGPGPSLAAQPMPPAGAVSIAQDPQIAQSLMKALEEANQDGYDYFEFEKSLEQQKTLIADERVRFQATNATASVMGVTPQKLIDSAQHYRSVLSGKEKEFLAALNQNKTNDVDLKQAQITKLDQELVAKAGLINKITQEINEMQTAKQQLESEITANQNRIEQVRSSFYATLQVFLTRIDTDIAKIRQYLLS